jgi:hypothetical protein
MDFSILPAALAAGLFAVGTSALMKLYLNSKATPRRSNVDEAVDSLTKLTEMLRDEQMMLRARLEKRESYVKHLEAEFYETTGKTPTALLSPGEYVHRPDFDDLLDNTEPVQQAVKRLEAYEAAHPLRPTRGVRLSTRSGPVEPAKNIGISTGWRFSWPWQRDKPVS